MSGKKLTTTTWPGGILQIKVPLPFALKWVNSYLLKDERGYTLIDPGLHTPEAVEAWEAAMEAHDVSFSDIHTILLTHQHPDHYGLAGWFQERCGAPVWISAQSYAYTQRLWGTDEGAQFASELTALYALHGMPPEIEAEILPHLASFIAKVSPQPRVQFLEAGQTVQMAGIEWQTIDAPGHAGGQLCFYAPAARWMICGDQVLPDITPNISVVPGEDDKQLEQFLASLAHLAQVEVDLAFPGHRDPFTDFKGRTEELAAHHVRRLDRMVEMVREEPCSGYSLCMRFFGERIAGNTHNLRFAMSETLAHLYYLEQRGRVARRLQDGKVIFCTGTAEQE
ncbi:MBL fold metallo-hydrolase [Paenibacillus sp. R14(2021)]|uniref:MBL fold metallo-hydrolase n=1 Tax=Paenibacillus sp. R14(2021) TaxID=2859228 RepID=UPI001C612B8A|nr:MBL fold metallo-hydrolase [Paenibacillus sp. R14(2021)]